MAKLSELRSEHKAVILKTKTLEQAITLLIAGRMEEAMPRLQDFANFIKKAILPHFHLEESVILPLLARRSEKSRALATKLGEGHVFLRECFDRYHKFVEYNPLDPRLQELCREMIPKLVAHAHKEDAVMIPMLIDSFGITEVDELPEHAPPMLYEEES